MAVIRLVDQCGGKYGFASGHAANTMGLAFFLWLHLDQKWMGALAIFWSLAVGYSRIYLGVHYPGDVMVGFLIGATFAWLVFKLMMAAFGHRRSTTNVK